jgi:hypothetical protein
MLFTDRSLWTMVHGIGFGGAALLTLSGALACMYLLRGGEISIPAAREHIRLLSGLSALTAAMLWLTAVVGTLIVFPPYRAAPPDGTLDLAQYPRSLILSDPETAWLHAFGMETKEHLPWIAVMLATAVAFVVWRSRARLFSDRPLRRVSMILLAICFVIVAYVSLLGVFINKVAPLY